MNSYISRLGSITKRMTAAGMYTVQWAIYTYVVFWKHAVVNGGKVREMVSD